MDYESLLETVFGCLDELGAAGAATPGEPVTDEALAAAEARMKVRLPVEFRELVAPSAYRVWLRRVPRAGLPGRRGSWR